MHARAERREHAGVLAADHPGPDDRERPRDDGQVQELVRVVDAAGVERELRRADRHRPDRHQHRLPAEVQHPAGRRRADHLHRVRVVEAAGPVEHGDPVRVEPAAHLLGLDRLHRPLVLEQVVDGEPAPQGQIDAEQPAAFDAAEGEVGGSP